MLKNKDFVKCVLPIVIWFGCINISNASVNDEKMHFEMNQVLSGSNDFGVFTREKDDLGAPRNSESRPIWIAGLFILQLIIVANLRLFYQTDFENLFKGLKSLNLSQQLYREQEMSTPFSLAYFNLNLIISVGFYVYFLADYFDIIQRNLPFIFFLFLLWIILILFSSRYATIKLMSIVYPEIEGIGAYNFIYFLAQNAFGLLLIPVNLLLAYAPGLPQQIVLSLSMILVAFLLIWIIVNGLTIGRKYVFKRKFHFFLYICTLEIAPILILVKILFDRV